MMESKTFLYQNGSWDTALPKFDTTDNSCVIVFGNNESEVLNIIKNNPGLNILGAMSSGLMYDGVQVESVTPNSSNLVLTYWKFNTTKVKIVYNSFNGYDDSFQLGASLMKQLYQDDLAGVITYIEGLNVNGAKYTEGFRSENPKNIPVAGGLAADNMNFTITKVYTPDGPVNVAGVAIGFYGKNFHMKTSSQSGVTSFGVERKVTKSIKNVLFELDNKPALDVYESFLGKRSADLPAAGLHFPVEICADFMQKDGLLRTPIMIDRDQKTITFTGEIPQGDDLRLMFAEIDSLINASETAADQVYKEIPSNLIDSGNFCWMGISCAARKAVLKSSLDEEITPSFEKFHSKKDSFVGFYSYGEIVTLNNVCSLVNQTMSNILVWEDDK